MASRILSVLLVAVVATLAQDQCGCGQQPTVIQMTCGGGAPQMPPPPPFHPPPYHPQPPPMHYSTSAPVETSTFDFISHLPSTNPITCTQDNDLVIVVDSSGSVGQSNYDVSLEFAARLGEAWKQHPGNGVSFIIYGYSAEIVIDMDQGAQMDAATLASKIRSTHYLAETTGTDVALSAALSELTNRASSRHVPKNVVLLTDGVSDDSAKTISTAQQLHAAGIRAVSVGVGSNLNNQELNEVAGNNPSHVFNTSQFDDLLMLLQPVSQSICPLPAGRK